MADLSSLPPMNLPPELRAVLEAAPSVTMPPDLNALYEASYGGVKDKWFEVAYDVPGKGRVVEAKVAWQRNGIAANYIEAYMRRRDPDSMVIADERPTNKETFQQRFGKDFEETRARTFDWLKGQDLVIFTFVAGQANTGIEAIAVAPANAGFFAYGLALLQGMLNPEEVRDGFTPRAVIYVAPPFRHTDFDGKQVVVHNRRENLHELFSYNLYPGPSAKKGIYGVLINIGEAEGWLTAHCSTVQVVTPYDNVVAIMHEGASGGGKSEMLEHVHREADGRLLLGANVITGEKRHLTLPRGCELHPVTDDMALCHPHFKGESGKLTLMDAESAWFVRVNHITHYGKDPHLEALTIDPPEPLLFLSIDAVPGGRALIWDHIEDEPGKPCPNPRVVIPRAIVPNVAQGLVTVDIRSFGVRTPPCTRENPTYGILGLFHLLPSSLAWLWRLVAPRGHDNPSITGTQGMSSEGVGSYWPFATGRRVDQANLLLKQIIETPRQRFIVCPNQHIGAWKVGFMGQWIAREYLSRRGSARFKPDQISPARCPLLGWVPNQLQVEGNMVGPWLRHVDSQPEVGPDAYDAGAEQLRAFFLNQLEQFYTEADLLPIGKEIIKCCMDNGTVDDYERIMPAQ